MTTDVFETQYLRFQRVDAPGKTLQWRVLTTRHGSILGTIRWFGPWRQYTFFPVQMTVFNRQCLRDIADFIDNVKNERNLAGRVVPGETVLLRG